MAPQPPYDEIAREAALMLGDLPNALRFRAHSVRHPAVPARFAEGTKNPVVLVPGVYETWHYLRPVAEALNAAGHPVHIVDALGFNRRPIPTSARIVWRRIRELDLDRVTIVAHSKGGLIGKHVLAFDDVEGRVVRVVAIATPFAGSRMASYAPPGALREFRPDGALIAELRSDAETNAFITSIAPAHDPHIPDGSHLPGARNVTLPVVGHFRILHDPQLPALVVAEVEREADDVETP